MSSGIGRCVGCGAAAAIMDGPGPVHGYMLASPGCWALFGEVSADERSDARYRVDGLQFVDAYAVQHPGVPERRSSQSVWIHAFSLCLCLEHHLPEDLTIRVIQRLASDERDWPWLEPPASEGHVTLVDVFATVTVEQHVDAVRIWCESLLDEWALHRDRIRAEAGRLIE